MCAYYVYQKIQVNQYKKTSKKDIGRAEGPQAAHKTTWESQVLWDCVPSKRLTQQL